MSTTTDTATTIWFSEDQRLRSPMFWAVALTVSAMFSGTVLWLAWASAPEIPVEDRVQLGAIRSENPTRTAITLRLAAGASVLANVGLLAFFALGRLQTEVGEQGIFVRFWPRQRKVRQLDLSDLDATRIVRMGLFTPYAAFGWSRGTKYAQYRMGNSRGVLLSYGNGYSVAIGSQAPEALEEAVRRSAGFPESTDP